MIARNVHRITLVELSPPASGKVEDEIVWVCRCFGLDPKRDKLAFEIFLHLLDASRRGNGVRTIEITRKNDVTQAAVVYHMNTFMRSGLIVRRGREYFLRGGNLEKAIDEMQLDMVRRMRMMRQTAEKIDELLMR